MNALVEHPSGLRIDAKPGGLRPDVGV